MRIGRIAEEAGVSTKAIRYYEELGLMPAPGRARNGYRDYGPEAVEQLVFIRDAQRTGLTLAEIASIVELRRQGESSCHHVIELLEGHLADVDRRIEALHASRATYATLIERARRLEPADCTDPFRCQTIAGYGAEDRVPDRDAPHAGHDHARHDHATPAAG